MRRERIIYAKTRALIKCNPDLVLKQLKEKFDDFPIERLSILLENLGEIDLIRYSDARTILERALKHDDRDVRFGAILGLHRMWILIDHDCLLLMLDYHDPDEELNNIKIDLFGG